MILGFDIDLRWQELNFDRSNVSTQIMTRSLKLSSFLSIPIFVHKNDRKSHDLQFFLGISFSLSWHCSEVLTTPPLTLRTVASKSIFASPELLSILDHSIDKIVGIDFDHNYYFTFVPVLYRSEVSAQITKFDIWNGMSILGYWDGENYHSVLHHHWMSKSALNILERSNVSEKYSFKTSSLEASYCFFWLLDFSS